jgi:hypothetical protein
MFRGLGVAAVAGLLTALALPASAARVTHESYTFSGTMADAKWFVADGQEPDVGTPRILSITGADAMSVHRVPGAKPERTPQPAVLAMALTMPGTTPGDDPYPAELWCVTESASFTVAGDLSEAALRRCSS